MKMTTRRKRAALRNRSRFGRQIARACRYACPCPSPGCSRHRRVMAACKAAGSFQPLADYIDRMARSAACMLEAGR